MVEIHNYSSDRYQRRFNAVLDVRRTVTGDELVTLAELKAHLKIDYNDDDALLPAYIKAARAALERYTGLSIVIQDVEATLRNDLGGMELPYGPLTGEATLTDSDDEDIDVTYTGLDFPTVDERYSLVKAKYESGYDSDTVPPDLKQAILCEAAHLWERRGDNLDTKNIVHSPIARSLADAHKRVQWLI